MTQTTPLGDLIFEFDTNLPSSESVDADDPDALDEWFTRCADRLMPYFEATEDHRGWMTDADLKVFVQMDTREQYEPVVEEKPIWDSNVTTDGDDEVLESTDQMEEVVVDRVLTGEVVGYYLDVQADTEQERKATLALAHALGLDVSAYEGSHTRFTHRLTHPDYDRTA